MDGRGPVGDQPYKHRDIFFMIFCFGAHFNKFASQNLDMLFCEVPKAEWKTVLPKFKYGLFCFVDYVYNQIFDDCCLFTSLLFHFEYIIDL